jgi:uncharacterized membrane protein YGL010W
VEGTDWGSAQTGAELVSLKGMILYGVKLYVLFGKGTMLVIPLNNFKINKMMKIRVKEIIDLNARIRLIVWILKILNF